MIPAALRADDDTYAALLRGGAILELESRLDAQIGTLPDDQPIRRIAAGLSAESVSVQGWDRLNTRLAVLSRNKPITAVGVDITAHGDGQDAQGWRIQALETCYYADTASYAFSTASPEALRQACAVSTPAWAGGFEDIDDALSIEGVSEMHDTLIRLAAARTRIPDPVAERGLFLGGWLRHLRVHQALARGLAEHGLARAIPVIVGSHDLAPHVSAPYWPERLRDFEAAADREIAMQAARNRAHYAKVTEDTVAEWTERRAAIRGWSPRVNPRQREQHIAFARAHETVQRMDFPDLKGLPYSFEGTDAAFAHLTGLYRHLRHPEEPRPTPPRPTWRERLFGR